MRIQIDEETYSGSAAEIMEQLRRQLWDTGDFPDVETYIWYLKNNYERMSGKECRLPQGSTEIQARSLIYSLAEIGALELLEEKADNNETEEINA